MKQQLLMTLALASAAAGCASPYYADRGAAFGGLTGAGVGAAIGEANDRPLLGAVVGGALGTVAGAAVGTAVDQDIARNNAIVQERLGRRLAGAVTPADVVTMTHAGLSDDVIITHIQGHGVAAPPQVNDLVALKQQGVSDRVINALQQQPPIQTAGRSPSYGPVVVEEYHYVRPYPRYHHHWDYHRHCSPPRRHPHSRVGFGVSFGH